MKCDDDKPAPWAATLQGLTERVLGDIWNSVHFRLSGQPGRHYSYWAVAGELSIAATDGVSAAVALHHFLRRHCGRAVHWDTALPLPIHSLPDAPETSGEARVQEGYYLNFCTFSYTMPYWTWQEWEREIDWMALHGVTMPLALTGHEAVLLAAYTRLGLTGEEVREFLGGPGYLPFQYMGCLDTFAGPLSQAWIDSHRDLGAAILERERSFGMTPVLPGFTGHVPRQLAPELASPRTWQGFTTHVLPPTDPLFEQVGAEITKAQAELYGTDHLYAADPFIEMPPVDGDPDFAGAVATSTLNGMLSADPHAVWLMQAWPFSYQADYWTDERIRDFLNAIPDDRLLLADLWAESDPQWQRLSGLSGKSWLWCALLNFGGRTEPIADVNGVVHEIDSALGSVHPPVGLGLSMEATRNNPVFFEFVADQLWQRPADATAWLPGFVAERYGTVSGPLLTAWQGLLNTVYDASEVRIFPELFTGVLTAKPSYSGITADVGPWLENMRAEVRGLVWYDAGLLVDAWARMIDAAENDAVLARGTLGHDLVDVGIAVMSRVADHLYLEIVEHLGDTEGDVRHRVERFLGVFDDLERLLGTRVEFTFEHWEDAAARWATDQLERAVLIDNARRIVTTWGESSSPLLDDYSGRVWSGLVGGYYRHRWALWAGGLKAAADADPAAGTAAADLDMGLRELADSFIRNGPRMLPPAGVQDTTRESRRLHTMYATLACSLPRASQHDRRRGAR
ncbi:alpha-N-acetylglucosaminidase [Phytoactinopolyspora mesophila]|uniref:Alpha-N-acetylglucosaminidase n=1 Tax=Phytoactinopolyspora mesophila TaxID=2650750 RepID=A0A7K3LZV2_9ACTN|nr:alpha-N-acetylglucosaminidase [Phytoactinopolyspora mesophila]NDL56202.1 alpha-N-acetylglucosaminidase [Phytoactinopolyspora mesophila]